MEVLFSEQPVAKQVFPGVVWLMNNLWQPSDFQAICVVPGVLCSSPDHCQVGQMFLQFISEGGQFTVH